MLTGKEKAQLLLSLLGDKAKNVLSRMSPESASVLTASIGDIPVVTPHIKFEFLEEILKNSKSRKSEPVEIDTPENSFDDSFQAESAFGNLAVSEPEIENNELTVDAPVTVEEVLSNDLRNPKEIALVLSELKPQIIAFVLSKIDESLKLKIEEFMSFDILTQVHQIRIEKIPLSDSIFNRIYDSVFKRSPMEELPKIDEESSSLSQKIEPEEGSFSWDQPFF